MFLFERLFILFSGDNCNNNASFKILSRSQAAGTEATLETIGEVKDGNSANIEGELKSETKEKKKKFNGWQIFGISIGAIFGLFFLCGILGSL